MNLVCPHCATTNRVPDARLDDEPTCGRCGHELMAARPAELDDARLARFVAASELPVLVDFWAAWCSPCRMMAPHFAAAAAHWPRIRFVKLDTEACPQSAARHQVRSLPTLVLFRGGREVARQVGAIGAADLERWLQAHV